MRQITLPDIRMMARQARGQIDRIFLHWTAGHYGQPFPDYHVNIDADGSLYTAASSLTQTLAHTWRQNTGSVGVAILCCYNGNTNSLGPEPPTVQQVETMAQVVAILCEELGLPIDIAAVRTHAEQADIDGYGPATTCERWDLLFLSDNDRSPGGDIIRSKAIWYQQNGIGG